MIRNGALICFGIVLVACTSARHPLDDSESRPSDLGTAVSQASMVLDDLDAEVLTDIAHDEAVWDAPQGCAVNQDSPEQGEVARVMYRSYRSLPTGTTSVELLGAAREHWRSHGHTVGEGSPDMAPQVIARIDGISYSLVDGEPGVEARAFLPCSPS